MGVEHYNRKTTLPYTQLRAEQKSVFGMPVLAKFELINCTNDLPSFSLI
jgi:hypothetical protein